VEANPDLEFTIDVERRLLEVPAAGISQAFPLDDATRERFLQGLDDIGLSLRHAGAITDFESNRPSWMPSTAV
jgi:3-isopropylmalate/(R)-2-methylmalate dehydratase small subunit